MTNSSRATYLLLWSLSGVAGCGRSDLGPVGSVHELRPVSSFVQISERARRILERTVVVGASVSSGHKAPSPVEKAADQVGTRGRLVNLARSGARGVDLLPTITIPPGTTAVVGVDLFFWDSQLTDCRPSLLAFRKLLAGTHGTGVELVLGNIPPLTSQQPCARELNVALQSECHDAHGCRLLDLEGLFIGLQDGGVTTLGGRDYRLAELMADRIHVNDAGSAVIAKMIIDRLN